MTSAAIQIKTAFEQEGMTPEQIAEDQSLDVGAVKSVLIQSSSIYRKACGMENGEVDDGLNFNDDELKIANKIIIETAMSAEYADGTPDFKTRLDAAKYIRDDKKGRKEVVRAVNNGNTFNILQLNEQFREAREAAESVKRKFIAA